MMFRSLIEFIGIFIKTVLIVTIFIVLFHLNTLILWDLHALVLLNINTLDLF